MAKDDDSYQRRKQREREEEEEDARKKAALNPGRGGTASPSASAPSSSGSMTESEKVLELMNRAEPMVEQLDHLYMMFVAGADKIPPNEKRKILDQIMATLQLMSKPSQSLAFRYNSLHSRYVAYRDRWDKLLKDWETGKLKRTKEIK